MKKTSPQKNTPPRPPAAFLSSLLARLAARAGAKVYVEPRFKRAGQIMFKNGRISYFRNTCLDINPLGATEIAKDKGYADLFLRRLGYKTVGGKVFLSTPFARKIAADSSPREALAHARKIGYPVIVKPNSLSQGVLVVKCTSSEELRSAIARVCRRDDVYLVQKFVSGFDDYRIVVLDGEVISAYRRHPLSITGDGISTIRQLLRNKQKQFIARGRDTRLALGDFRILQNLQRQKLTFQSILSPGKKIFLLENANLSSGGDAEDVTHTLHKSFARLAVRITREMGLRLCGVDLFVRGDIAKPLRDNYKIIEINAAPGLDHYAASGAVQQKNVEEMYLKVLRAMGKK